jgi:hypothetical protein
VRDPTKRLGPQTCILSKIKNKSRAQVRIYMQGRPEDTTAKKDTISMNVIFEAPGLKLTKPKYATFAFSVYSAEKSKYSKNHNMQIYIRGIEGVNRAEWRTRLLMTKPLSTGGTLEIFLSLPLKYERIERMANAGEVMVTIGDSRFALKNQDLQALRDLNQTIEKYVQSFQTKPNTPCAPDFVLCAPYTAHPSHPSTFNSFINRCKY